MIEPKTCTEAEVIDLMLQTVKTVRKQCSEIGQPFRVEDAIDQVFTDMNEAGLIEFQP